MNKLPAIAALLAAVPIALVAALAAAGSLSPPSAVAGADGGIVLAAGMGGGNTGGMGGGTGGMGGGNTGGMGGGTGGMGGGNAGGMGGGNFGGGMFRGPPADFDQPGQQQGASGAPSDNYTYQCVTAAGRCSFVGAASARASSLRRGALCACGGGPPNGRVE
jgi:hypothetical protein